MSLVPCRDIFHSHEPNRISRQESLQKLSETQKLITGMDGPTITASCSKLIFGKFAVRNWNYKTLKRGEINNAFIFSVTEGKLKVLKGRAFHERHVFLFDALIVITKPHKNPSGNQSQHYTYKNSYLMKVRHNIYGVPDTVIFVKEILVNT